MDTKKRKALEARGYKVYDHAADAVGLTDDERELLDFRVRLATRVRKLREELQLSQNDLAVRLKMTEPRIARIERAARSVSLDHIFRAYAALGGELQVKRPSVLLDRAGKKTSKS